MMRGGVISLLYGKSTDIALNDVDAASSLTLMSADVERIVTGMQTAHEVWANTVEVALAIYLLGRQLGAACAVPIGVALSKLFHDAVTISRELTTYSIPCRIIGRHWSGDVTPGPLASSYRAPHRCYHLNVKLHERCKDVWPYRCSAR